MTKNEFEAIQDFLIEERIWENQVLLKSVTKTNRMLIKSESLHGNELYKLLKKVQKQQVHIAKMIEIDESLFWLDEMYSVNKEEEDDKERQEGVMHDSELWDGIFNNLWLHYFEQEERPGIIEVFDQSFTFELRLANHPLKYYLVSYTTNNGKVLVDWDTLEQIEKV